MTTRSLGRVIVQMRRAALPSDLGDGELLARFIDYRDEAAFEALVRRHGAMVLGVCRRLLASPHDAEDAFQATFIVLVRRAAAVVPRDAVGNWLYGVAYRTALEARSARARRRAREGQVSTVTAGPDAHEEAARRELHQILDRELAALPAKYRTPVVCCDLEGRSLREAARLLGWPEGTLATRLRRARHRLARRLAGRGLTLAGGALAALLSREAARATVPGLLVQSTVQAAGAVAAGQATATLPPSVAALAEGVVRIMFLNRLKFLSTLFVVAGLLCFEVGVLFRAMPAAGGIAAAAAEDPPKDAAKDHEVGLPRGWFGGSANQDAYEVGIDRKVFHGGKVSAYVRMKDAAETEFGTLAQTIQARAYRGKRLRLTAYVKTEKTDTGTALWMRVDGKGTTLSFDNMDDRPVKGTKDWHKVTIVLDVPKKAEFITIGLLLAGNGKAWVDDFRLEAVGRDVRSTNQLEKEVETNNAGQTGLDKPTNLDFEEGIGDAAQPAPAAPLSQE
jgi:RNA polymerase sigma factor (sigma-70 family)